MLKTMFSKESKTIITRMATLAVCAVMALAMFGCGSDSPSENASTVSVDKETTTAAAEASAARSDDGKMTVQIVFEYPDSVDPEVYPPTEGGELKVPAGSTVNDVLVGTNYDIVETDGFVESINGLGSNDIVSGSGWTYTVNDDYAEVPANEYPVEDGDVIVWSFYVPE